MNQLSEELKTLPQRNTETTSVTSMPVWPWLMAVLNINPLSTKTEEPEVYFSLYHELMSVAKVAKASSSVTLFFRGNDNGSAG